MTWYPVESRRTVRPGRAVRIAALGVLLATVSRPSDGQDFAQGFTIVPVTVEMPSGQLAAVLTLQNESDRDATFQVRPYAWAQPQGPDELTATDVLVVSPPLGVIRAHARQVVRVLLRRPAGDREAAYRILIDEIPPPPAPGSVGFTLRISIPVFAEPAARISPRVRWRVDTTGEGAALVAVNEGARRQVVRDMVLVGPGGRRAELESGVSPYILAGATRRWRIMPSGPAPAPGEDYRLTAHGDNGAIDQAVSVQRVAP
jgi:fimbrial chaperone protein